MPARPVQAPKWLGCTPAHNPAMDLRLEQFTASMRQGGIDAGIAFLNAAVPHRYTAIYRLNQRVLSNIALFDKQGEVVPEALAEVPFEDSFCQFVLRDGLFRTGCSTTEPVLDGHPYQGVMLSYTGVPIEDDAGALWGTLCHFDLDAHDVAVDEYELLLVAGKILRFYLRPAA